MAVRFDDRLKTVLAQPASHPHDRAIRWRQLVEIVARAGSGSDSDLLRSAVQQIRDDSAKVDERTRVAAALSVASLDLPASLVAAFASDRLSVAAPILASATLSAEEWAQVAETASKECGEFIAKMRSDEPAQAPAPPAGKPAGPTAEEPAIGPTIGDVVARIERLRKSRSDTAASPQAAHDHRAPPRLFRWECSETGDIEWVEGAPRGALIGQSIAQSGSGEGVDRSVERAFAARAPFQGGTLVLARGGVTEGRWAVSGVPAFEPATGRFAGYRGIAERTDPDSARSGAEAPDSSSIRELAHEIRTPLNAIIGFAEMISGEYLGPAEGRYRERANDILAQAKLLLAAVEDLDLAASMPPHSARSDLSSALAQGWESIEGAAQAAGVAITVDAGPGPAECALAPHLAERIVNRLVLALLGGAAAGETLALRIAAEGKYWTLSIALPESLRDIDLRPERNRRSSDTQTLALRLVSGLARTAGGDLKTQAGMLVLRLPKA